MNVTWLINDVEVRPRNGVKIQESLERYDALPGLESVRSTLTIKAIQDLFKNGKIKLTCLARVYNLYNHTKEIELQEDSPLLALVMVVPTTHSNEGINNGNRAASISPIHFLAGACSVWLRARHVIH